MQVIYSYRSVLPLVLNYNYDTSIFVQDYIHRMEVVDESLPSDMVSEFHARSAELTASAVIFYTDGSKSDGALSGLSCILSGIPIQLAA